MTPLKPNWPGPVLGGMNAPVRIARRHPMPGAHERRGGADEHQNNDELDGNDDAVDASRFMNADDQQRRNPAITTMAGTLMIAPVVCQTRSVGVIGKRRAGNRRRNDDAEILEKAHDVARPADGDGDGAERVFENQVPADDPGDEFAHCRVGIRVGAAGDRDRGCHFGIAKTGKSAGKGAEDEGQRDRRAGIGRGRMSGQDENAGADNGADAERRQVERRQGALERQTAMRRQRLHLRLFGFGLQCRHRFARPDIRHASFCIPVHKPGCRSKPPPPCRLCLATRSIEKCSIASLNRR